jgi:hypothetical protein
MEYGVRNDQVSLACSHLTATQATASRHDLCRLNDDCLFAGQQRPEEEEEEKELHHVECSSWYDGVPTKTVD